MTNFEAIKEEIRKLYPHTSEVTKLSSSISVKILIPKITITNNIPLSHEIRDLLVVFTIENILLEKEYDPVVRTHLYYRNLQAKRLTRTSIEVREGYSHSHLSGTTSNTQFNGFCLGNSDLGTVLSQGIVNDVKENIASFLFILEGYLGYESLEGGPYRVINSLIGNTNINLSTINFVNGINDRNFLRVIKTFPKILKSLKIKREVFNAYTSTSIYNYLMFQPQKKADYLYIEGHGLIIGGYIEVSDKEETIETAQELHSSDSFLFVNPETNIEEKTIIKHKIINKNVLQTEESFLNFLNSNNNSTLVNIIFSYLRNSIETKLVNYNRVKNAHLTEEIINNFNQ